MGWSDEFGESSRNFKKISKILKGIRIPVFAAEAEI